MRRAKQFRFQGFEKANDYFGGSLLNGNNPKVKRPLESKLPVHLTLRACKGGMRLPRTLSTVDKIVWETAKRHGIKIYRYANVGNHLHIVLKISHIYRWSAFIRELTGRIASVMREFNITNTGEKFWLHRPFTRIVRGWKKAYRHVCEYVHLNVLEAEGFINRRETRTLRDLHEIWKDP